MNRDTGTIGHCEASAITVFMVRRSNVVGLVESGQVLADSSVEQANDRDHSTP